MSFTLSYRAIDYLTDALSHLLVALLSTGYIRTKLLPITTLVTKKASASLRLNSKVTLSSSRVLFEGTEDGTIAV